jgi:serine/threonine protein kinase
MLDHKVSPLLDAMEVGECFARHDGASCYYIRHPESGREFVLKHISVPAGEGQVEALLLTGAYANEQEADAYYRKEAEALVQEAENRKRLLDCPYILPFLGVQMEKKEGVGYEIYAVLPKRNSLETYLNENAVSHLRGINMGIDLCVALSALREEGYVHGNLKPGNVFFSDTGRFLLGDFGLISTEDMQYAILPEQYRSSFSAPELSGILGGLNPTVDIYSLGMILYRIYNGNHAPFEDEKTNPKDADARRVAGEALPVPIYADYELAAIICKACAFDPADRYQTPEEMRLELEQYMRRNAVSDHLIVPPLVTDGETLSPEEAAAEAEPVRFADPEKLDDNFKKAFAPGEGKKNGRDKQDKKQKKASVPQPAPAKSAPPKPAASKAAPAVPPQVAADRRRMENKLRETQKRKKRGWILFALVLALLVTGICLYEFTDLGKGMWHYFVSVDDLTVSDVTADSLRLKITTDADPADFTALCQDSYGNSWTGSFTDGVAEFRGLNPNTQYSLSVELPGLHKLSGHTSAAASTKALTEIETFRVLPDAERGSVRLELAVKEESTVPAFWTLRYGKTGQEPEEIQFAGTGCRVSGLENGETYTFTLVQTDNLYLSGQTQIDYTPSDPVEVSDLRLDAIQDTTALLSWHCATELPGHWELSCSDAEGQELSVEYREAEAEEEGWRCTAAVSGVAREVDYTVTLNAPGLVEPQTLTLRNSGVSLTDFTAEATADGLVLHWTADREPGPGWRITAAFGDGLKLETLARGEGCTMAVLPETDYTVTITPADGSSVTGENKLTVRSGEELRFTQLGVTKKTSIGLYDRPDKENYGYGDLNLTGTVRFRATTPVCFAIVAGGSPVDSDETVTVQYVVRDAKTHEILSAAQEQVSWNSLWDKGRFVGDLRQEWLPDEPGSYTFAVYVNSQRLGGINFTLLG